MRSDAELYEDIFCTQDGHENRAELLEKHKDRLPALRREHERSGVKINGKAISFPISEEIASFELFEKLKNFYAQPIDGCWPLNPRWVPDLKKPPKHVFSRNVAPGQAKTRVTAFRRFTYNEFLEILKVKK